MLGNGLRCTKALQHIKWDYFLIARPDIEGTSGSKAKGGKLYFEIIYISVNMTLRHISWVT